MVARGVSVAGVAVTSGRGAARLTLRLRIGLARSGLIFCRPREWTITDCGGDGAVRLWITRRKLNRELPLTVLIETQRELAEIGVTDGHCRCRGHEGFTGRCKAIDDAGKILQRFDVQCRPGGAAGCG